MERSYAPRRPFFLRSSSALLAGLFASLLLLLPLVPRTCRAQLGWYELKTPDLRIVYYDREHSYVLPHLARSYENAMAFYEHFFDYTPTEEVTILFQDFDDYGYAGTSTIPNNFITLGIEPYEHVYEVSPTNERFNWVMMHELVHVVASEKATGADDFFRSLFLGKVPPSDEEPLSLLYNYLSNPRRYAPRWYHEGIAVFMETWLAGGIGRSLGGYDEMVFRAMVHDDAFFYDVVGLESEGTTSDFQIGQNSYLYGTRFMSYLAVRYGPEKVIEWVKRSPGSHAGYWKQFHKVFSRSLDEEWKAWIEFEHQWQRDNLARVDEFPVTAERTLFQKPLGSVSRGYYDPLGKQLYVAVNFPGDFAHLLAIDLVTGNSRRICDVQTPALYYVTSLAWDDSSRTLFYTSNNSKYWRDLHQVDPETGKDRVLIKNFRTGDLVLNRADHTLWGIQHHNGKSTVVRITPPWDSWDHIQELIRMPFGRDIYDLDVSPDGKYLTAAMSEIDGSVRLVRMETAALLQGDSGFEVLYQFDKTGPANFVHSPDGRYLYGTAYQTGVSNVFRFDTREKTMDAVTNVETGYFRPIPALEDSLIVFRYTSKGFIPVMIADATLHDVNAVRYLGNEVVERFPVVRSWKLGSPAKVPIDSLVTDHGEYHMFKSIGVTSLYPVAHYYKDHTAVGARLNFMDPVGLNGGSLTATVSPFGSLPDNELVHARFKFTTWPWTLEASWNLSDFYDFFGPTKRSYKGWSASVDYDNYLIADKPRFLEYSLGAAHYGGLERSPFYQNVAATFDNYTLIHAELRYRRLRRSIGAVDAEKGLKWNAGYGGNFVNDRFYSSFRGRFDLGFLLPIDHSSIWWRNWGGYSFGDRNDSFANFYLGGFGNNVVDHGSIKRYRDFESFPGLELNEFSGTNYLKSMVEWTLPPLRFRRFGIPAVYLTWARPAVFTSAVVGNIGDGSFQHEAYNLGAQIDFHLVFYSGLSSTLSVGYASAWWNGTRPSREFMISLKIL